VGGGEKRLGPGFRLRPRGGGGSGGTHPGRLRGTLLGGGDPSWTQKKGVKKLGRSGGRDGRRGSRWEAVVTQSKCLAYSLGWLHSGHLHPLCVQTLQILRTVINDVSRSTRPHLHLNPSNRITPLSNSLPPCPTFMTKMRSPRRVRVGHNWGDKHTQAGISKGPYTPIHHQGIIGGKHLRPHRRPPSRDRHNLTFLAS